MLKQVIHFGLPSGVQNSIIAFANVIVQSNINAFGSNAMAGCGTYAKLEGFAFLPITCFTMALTTFVSQNLGAHQYDRVKKGVRFGIVCSTTLAECIGVVLFLLAEPLVAIFQNDPAVIEIGVRQAHVEALFFCFLAFAHCIAGIMRGAGKPMVPMFIMLAIWCVLRVAYISIVVPLVAKIDVIFTAYPLTWGVSCIIFLIYFLKSDWLHNYDRLEPGFPGGRFYREKPPPAQPVGVVSTTKKQPLRTRTAFGATGRTRTGDLLITNQLLYQLSHSSMARFA